MGARALAEAAFFKEIRTQPVPNPSTGWLRGRWHILFMKTPLNAREHRVSEVVRLAKRVGEQEAEIARLLVANNAWKAQIDVMASRIAVMGYEAANHGKNARRFRRRVRRAGTRMRAAWRYVKKRHEAELLELRALRDAVEVFQERAHAMETYTVANAMLDVALEACSPGSFLAKAKAKPARVAPRWPGPTAVS
jgi:hypothetical protein